MTVLSYNADWRAIKILESEGIPPTKRSDELIYSNFILQIYDIDSHNDKHHEHSQCIQFTPVLSL